MSDQTIASSNQTTATSNGINNEQLARIEISKAVKISVNEPQGAWRFWLPLAISGISLLVSGLSFSVSNIYVHHKVRVALAASNQVKLQRRASRDRDGNLNEVIDLVFMNEGTVTETILTSSLITSGERWTSAYGSQEPFTLKSGESKLIEITIPVRDVERLIATEGTNREIKASTSYVSQDGKIEFSQFLVTTISKLSDNALTYKLDNPFPAPFIVFNDWYIQTK